MRKPFLFLLSFIITFFSYTHTSCQNVKEKSFTLKDFYTDNPELNKKVNELFDGMSLEERASQMIITAAGKYGKPHDQVKKLVQSKKVGGVLLLNGTKDGFTELVRELNSITSETGQLPMVFSADAEPSLINRKIQGTTEVKKTSEIEGIEDCKKVTSVISNDLLNIGISHNYAPVIDISEKNEAIGNRSFGTEPLEVVNMAMAFMETTQNMNIAATIKHFPGHGKVKGDTHEKLVFIDGEMTEVNNYRPFIDAGAASIMVAHLAVKNNSVYDTKGEPASCSKLIVSELLRKEMGFKGIIITDAMNMGALNSFENAPFSAAKAGCDMILMPPDEIALHKDLVKALGEKTALRSQLDASVKRIIRFKLCLGLM
jgi:beta-N-acetylhexosaminidase